MKNINLKYALVQPWMVALLLLIITMVRIVLMFFSPFQASPELFFDEAQYWTWAQDLELGYYSKPPMVAWLIHITTSVCGDTAFCIRLAAPLLHGLTAFGVYLLGWELYNRRTGFLAAMLYITLPGVTAGSMLISSDVPLMFFWVFSLLCFAKALDGDGDKWWLIAGIFAGFGLLSKYTMIMLFVSLMFYMILHKSHRKFLFSFPLIISVLTALLFFFPNILWNLGNNFVSFSHTQENVVGNNFSLNYSDFFEFIGAQFGIFGPIPIVILGITFMTSRHYLRTKEGTLLLCTTIVLMLAGGALALLKGAQAHWIAPAYIAGSILVVHSLLHHGKIRWLYITFALHGVLCIVAFAASPIGNLVGYDPYQRSKEWNGLVPFASKALLANPNAILASDERKAVATLMYRLKTPEGIPYPVHKWNPDKKIHDHYDLITDLKTDLSPYIGYDVVMITRNQNIDRFIPYITNISLLEKPKIEGEQFYIFMLYGFGGYQR